MPRRRSAAEVLRAVPPRVRVRLRRLGIDLDNPADARLFADGARAAEEAIAEQERWELANLEWPPDQRSSPRIVWASNQATTAENSSPSSTSF